MRSRVFIAIHGQCAQLRQVAPWPAVGASMNDLPGHSCCIFQRMPRSVATMKIWLGRVCAALISWLVEPTASARATTDSGDSGCTSTAASGYSSLRSCSCLALNSSWTMHEPCQSSMSAPVSRCT
ncbi:hypothetical protein D3C78_1288580 [compost metagenome]